MKKPPSLCWVEEMKFERLVFHFSHEENTHAYTMEDDVPEDEEAQTEEVMELQAGISEELNLDISVRSLRS